MRETMPPEKIGPDPSATRGTGPNAFKDDEHQLDKSSSPETQADGEGEQQKCLSLRWETKHHWPELRKEFGVTKTGAAVILSRRQTIGCAIHDTKTFILCPCAIGIHSSPTG